MLDGRGFGMAGTAGWGLMVWRENGDQEEQDWDMRIGPVGSRLFGKRNQDLDPISGVMSHDWDDIMISVH